MATLVKAVRRVKVYSASPELLLGILMFSIIVLAFAGAVQKLVTGSFFFNHSPNKGNLVLAQQLKDEGNRLLNQRRYADAADKLEEGLAMDGKDAKSRFNLASAYISLGENDKALDELKECVSLDKSNSGAYFYIHRLVRPYDPDRAFSYLKKAKKADPRSAYLDVEMGIAYREKGDAKNAIASFRDALEKTPATSNYRKNLIAAIAEMQTPLSLRAEPRQAGRMRSNLLESVETGSTRPKPVGDGSTVPSLRAAARAVGEVRAVK